MATHKLSIIYLCIRRLVRKHLLAYPSSWTHQLSIILSVQVCYRTCKVVRVEKCQIYWSVNDYYIHLLCKLHEIWSTDSQESHSNCCHEMSHFKAENAPNSISLTALPQTFQLDIRGPTSKGKGKQKRGKERRGKRGGKKKRRRKGEEGGEKKGGKSGPPRIL